jgi:hypothetical protein
MNNENERRKGDLTVGDSEDGSERLTRSVILNCLGLVVVVQRNEQTTVTELNSHCSASTALLRHHSD